MADADPKHFASRAFAARAFAAKRFGRESGASPIKTLATNDLDVDIGWPDAVMSTTSYDTFSITLVTGGLRSIEVRADEFYDTGFSMWTPMAGNIGVLLTADVAGAQRCSIAQLEAGINAGALCDVTTPSPTVAFVDVGSLDGATSVGAFA